VSPERSLPFFNQGDDVPFLLEKGMASTAALESSAERPGAAAAGRVEAEHAEGP
jgi:hypothetical protein